jgi:hypothetical protein
VGQHAPHLNEQVDWGRQVLKKLETENAIERRLTERKRLAHVTAYELEPGTGGSVHIDLAQVKVCVVDGDAGCLDRGGESAPLRPEVEEPLTRNQLGRAESLSKAQERFRIARRFLSRPQFVEGLQLSADARTGRLAHLIEL